MVESERKHGPFDFGYPVRRKTATPVWELQRHPDRAGRLEWSIFLARFFASRGRHDFEALAAHEAYRNALERAASPQRSPARRHALATGRAAERGVVNSPLRANQVQPATGARVVTVPSVSGSPALVDWESEGGSVARDSD